MSRQTKMDYQTFRPVTMSRQTNKQKTINRNNFSDHNYIYFFQKSKTTKPPNTNNQNQLKPQNRNVPQQVSQPVFFNDQPRATLDRSEDYPFLQQNKNIANKQHTRNQPHYSEDEEF